MVLKDSCRPFSLQNCRMTRMTLRGACRRRRAVGVCVPASAWAPACRHGQPTRRPRSPATWRRGGGDAAFSRRAASVRAVRVLARQPPPPASAAGGCWAWCCVGHAGELGGAQSQTLWLPTFAAHGDDDERRCCAVCASRHCRAPSSTSTLHLPLIHRQRTTHKRAARRALACRLAAGLENMGSLLAKRLSIHARNSPLSIPAGRLKHAMSLHRDPQASPVLPCHARSRG